MSSSCLAVPPSPDRRWTISDRWPVKSFTDKAKSLRYFIQSNSIIFGDIMKIAIILAAAATVVSSQSFADTYSGSSTMASRATSSRINWVAATYTCSFSPESPAAKDTIITTSDTSDEVGIGQELGRRVFETPEILRVSLSFERVSDGIVALNGSGRQKRMTYFTLDIEKFDGSARLNSRLTGLEDAPIILNSKASCKTTN